MTPPTGIYQNTKSAGFLFGIIATPLLIIACVFYLYWKGFKSNQKYRHASRNKFPLIVFIYRAAALCLSVFIFLSVLLIDNQAWSYLAYFTTWVAIVTVVYFALGVVISSKRTFQQALLCESDMSSGEKRLVTIHQIAGEAAIPTAWISTTILWGLSSTVSVETIFGIFLAVALHLLNALALSVDFFLSDYLVNPHHFPAPLLLIFLYYFWHLIANATFGLMCYMVMLTDDSGAFIGFYLAGIAICFVLFAVMFGISVVKSRGICCNRVTRDDTPTQEKNAVEYDCESQAHDNVL